MKAELTAARGDDTPRSSHFAMSRLVRTWPDGPEAGAIVDAPAEMRLARLTRLGSGGHDVAPLIGFDGGPWLRLARNAR